MWFGGRLARNEVLSFDRYRSELVVRDELGRALFVERYDLQPGLRPGDLASASFPVLGKVIVAGTARGDLRLKLGAHPDDPCLGYDELPSGAGHVVRIAGQRMEDVAGLVERTVGGLLEGAVDD